MHPTNAATRPPAGSPTTDALENEDSGETSQSPWNAYLDMVLAANLKHEELRRAIALARYIIGWKRESNRIVSNHIGRDLLRDATGLHGKSFERARDALVARGLLAFKSSGPGRGKRTYYELPIPYIAAPEWPIENAAPERQFTSENAAQNAAQNAAPERRRSQKLEVKRSSTSPNGLCPECRTGGGRHPTHCSFAGAIRAA
jgi:hypothetical protein